MDIGEQPGRYKGTKFEPIHEATCQKLPDIGRAIPISDCCSLEDAGQLHNHLRLLRGAVFRYRLTPAFTSCSRLRRRARQTRWRWCLKASS